MAKAAMTTQNTGALTLAQQEEAFAREFAGAGVSTKAADNIVPQVRILQPLSPEIVDDPPLKDAKAGDFLMGSLLIPGKKGFWYQPCFWDQRWFEFMPLDQGGGFVASYEWLGEDKGVPIAPKDAKKIDDYHFKMGNNELLHYRQWAGIAWIDQRPLERVINFKSTGHTVARNWNNTAREANRFADGASRPLFMHLYHLTTEKRSNASGTWFSLNVGHPVLLSSSIDAAKAVVGDDIIAVAKLGANLFNAFQQGSKVAERDERVQTDQKKEGENVPF